MDRAGQIMQIEQGHVELLIGRGKFPLEYPEVLVPYVENTWIVSLAGFLGKCNGSVVTNRARVLK